MPPLQNFEKNNDIYYNPLWTSVLRTNKDNTARDIELNSWVNMTRYEARITTVCHFGSFREVRDKIPRKVNYVPRAVGSRGARIPGSGSGHRHRSTSFSLRYLPTEPGEVRPGRDVDPGRQFKRNSPGDPLLRTLPGDVRAAQAFIIFLPR